MEPIFLYMTCADRNEARRITTSLLEGKLIACANIFPAHEAVFRWEDQVVQEQEVAVIMKSRAGFFSAIEDSVKEHHSYETPCIVAWPIEQGAPEFLQWIERNTSAVK